MYNVYQHWDPLKVCIVGRSYPPEFYSFVSNSRVRSVLERIAIETEEDYQKLITLLKSFGVEILRPNVSSDWQFYAQYHNQIPPPPMTPRDYTIMLGKDFYFKATNTLHGLKSIWREPFIGSSWPKKCPTTYDEIRDLPDLVRRDCEILFDLSLNCITTGNSPENIDIKSLSEIDRFTWASVIESIVPSTENVYHSVPLHLHKLNAACETRIGRDIYVGTHFYGEDISQKIRFLKNLYPDYRWHIIDTGGHSDSTYCPVCPGLIVSLFDVPTYSKTFPDWEVVYLPGQSWSRIKPFLDLKTKNKGKWWVPGEELNDEFTEFVEGWLSHWTGYVEETVFDVNMLVINEKNVVCNNYNEKVFKTLERYGITPHVLNFRHRYFWDGGLHCITSDLHREGVLKDYFPARNTA